ncbi:superoxide dismutase family protein [Salinimicrobium sp. GXAS 041]|uniref:superoxide dismutase family protein n=1 Tax=Salinimicrobium sp. GXAS 041 TaxID=3400806 RepID=UPI003C7340D3
MKRISLGLLFSAAIIFTGCRNENQTAEDRVEENVDMTQENEEMQAESTDGEEIRVDIESKSDSNVTGTAVFMQENGEVSMTVELTGLTEGTHAIHLHEKADCSAEDGSSAGGHWNPTFEDHGEWGDEDGYHKGDIGNFEADADGNATIKFSTDEWCIGCDDDSKNIVGTAVVVHAGADDYVSQPSGDSGNRIACGEVTME